MKVTTLKDIASVTMDKNEALVLFDLLQRFVENEKPLLPLLESSAEFAVLCRINSHLEKALAEPFRDDYDELLARARKAIVKESGRYIGIEEK